MPQDWIEEMESEIGKPYFASLSQFVDKEYDTHICYPAKEDIFKAFKLCPFKDVKVVILGQDPYHEPGQAQGLAFSVPNDIKMPPSLRNIFKELASDLQQTQPSTENDLTRWAKQGVLLLNATLTVQQGTAGSHTGNGWETFTDAVIQRISKHRQHIVFLLWGNNARKKNHLIDQEKHCVLQSAHPSPLSAWHGFFGNHHFSQTNNFLSFHHITPINW